MPQSFVMSVPSYDLYASRQIWRDILKAEDAPHSTQGVAPGKKSHPFNFDAAARFQTSNVHHSTCIHTKTNATVGIGFEDDAADKALDPLCDISFANTLTDVDYDYWEVGNGYLEVVRDPQGNIAGLHHIPAAQVYVYVENEQYDSHFIVNSSREDARERHFARFGDKEAFLARWGQSQSKLDPTQVAEVIHFPHPTSLHRYYGYPDWLAAGASIELTQALHQFKYDFFLNRGVPEMIVSILGAKLGDKEFEELQEVLKGNIGMGNSHKSVVWNIEHPEVKVQVDKLAMESKGQDEFGDLKENLALDIVSAHRVPPLLAGIQIPGKLGAVNELPNALMSFYVLVVGPAQRLFQQILGKTLGNAELNGNLGLKPENFTFKKIVDLIDLGLADTVSRMRTPAAAAEAEGRDPADGLKD